MKFSYHKAICCSFLNDKRVFVFLAFRFSKSQTSINMNSRGLAVAGKVETEVDKKIIIFI